MKPKIDLPICEPIYGTYHYQGCGSAIISGNPSIRNYYLNVATSLTCHLDFRNGYTSPKFGALRSSFRDNPHIESIVYPMKHLGKDVHRLIRSLLNDGYYVRFEGIDDYYVKGKTFYQKRHYSHDGMICGYDAFRRNYTIFAYDEKWIYRRFQTPCSAWEAGRIAEFREGRSGTIYGLKAKPEPVLFQPELALKNIQDYLDPYYAPGTVINPNIVHGCAAQVYLAEYINELFLQHIPYERSDRRIFRQLWEHKRLMLERIGKIECEYGLSSEHSSAYRQLVATAERLKSLYTFHMIQRRDDLLPAMRDRLLTMEADERTILTQLVQRQ